MKNIKLTNTDISQWIDNDEGLYTWYKSSRQSKPKFIQENKQDLIDCITAAINKPPRERSWRDYC